MSGYASIPVHRVMRCLALAGAVVAVTIGWTAMLAASLQVSPRQTPSSQAEISTFQQAEELIQKGLFPRAVDILEAELKENPGSVEAYNLLGIAYTGEKHYERAADSLHHALKLSPNSTPTHNNLGNLYVEQQKFDLAEKEFQRVLSIVSANRDANYNLGLLLLAKGAPGAAIQHFQRVTMAPINRTGSRSN